MVAVHRDAHLHTRHHHHYHYHYHHRHHHYLELRAGLGALLRRRGAGQLPVHHVLHGAAVLSLLDDAVSSLRADDDVRVTLLQTLPPEVGGVVPQSDHHLQ